MPSVASCASNTDGGDAMAIDAAAHRPKRTNHTFKNNVIRMNASIGEYTASADSLGGLARIQAGIIV